MGRCSKRVFLLLVFDVLGLVLLYLTSTNERMNMTRRNVQTGNITHSLPRQNHAQSGNFLKASQNGDTLIYSAYAVDIGTGRNILRIIGVAVNKNRSIVSEPCHCRLRYNMPNKTFNTADISGFVENIPEDHDLNYTAAYFICQLHNLPVPDAVSIIYNNTTRQAQYIEVKSIPNSKPTHLFTVCLSPMHSGYNDSSQLMEWIEFNRILGVQKFNIYVNNVTEKIKTILKHYKAEGVLEVIPWSIPPHLCTFGEHGTHLQYCGQLVALNDCLYRTKGRSRYIVSLDLDEFIIPQHKDDITWSDMLKRIPFESSGYLFLNSFISSSTTEEYENYLKTNLLTMSYLTRDSVVFIGRVRSKMIARTDKAVTLGVHNVWTFTSGRERGVFPYIGLLHHYRDKLVEYPDNVPVKRFKTNATLKYFKRLQENVHQMQNSLKDVFNF